MKRVVFLLFVSLFVVQLVAQNEMMNAARNLSIAAQSNNSLERGIYIEGSPYKEKEKVIGAFYQKNNPLVETQTRLNYYQSSFEFIVEDKTYLVDASTIDSVILNGTSYVYKTFDVNGKKLPRVVEVVDRIGENSIYKYTEVEFKPEVKAGGYIDPKPASYNWFEPVYLIEIGDDLAILTNFNKLIGAFPEEKDVWKKFIKENKIKKDDPEDLKLLLRFISNSI